jgi:rRNA-processing protein EBP2
MQVITLPNTSGESVQDIHDDMARELAFYTAAKTAADEAIRRFDDASIPWQRPPDYYAESVKSDGHMAKVKQQLMYEEQAIEQAELRCCPGPYIAPGLPQFLVGYTGVFMH